MQNDDIKKLVETRYGKNIAFSNECEELSLHIKKSIQAIISPQTLRRLLGFIDDGVLPSKRTLHYISMYCGFQNFQELEKNLAQVVSSNLAALKVGGNSVAGLELTKEAAGKLGYDPTVLLKIARRADADLTNIDMMATALQKHSQRFGDANAQRFTKMWSDNADSKVFQIMNIYRDIEDPKLREAAAAEIVKDKNESQREVLTKKFQRIVELTETGDLRR